MLVLHGSWRPGDGIDPGRFVLWGECATTLHAREARRRKTATAARAKPHPFAASGADLREAFAALTPDSIGAGTSTKLTLQLPAHEGMPLPSPAIAAATLPEGATPELTAWLVDAVSCEIGVATGLLSGLAGGLPAPGIQLSDDLRFWATAARYGFELLHRGRFIPVARSEAGRHTARWRAALDDREQGARVALLVRSMPPACRATAAGTVRTRARDLLHDFLDSLIDHEARTALAATPPATAAVATGRRVAKQASPAVNWMNALVGAPAIAGTPAVVERLTTEIRAWSTPAPAAAADTFRVCLRLDPPEDAQDGHFAPPPALIAEGSRPPRAPAGERPPSSNGERTAGASTTVALRPIGAGGDTRPWRLRFFLQATDDPSLLVPAADVWRERGATGRFLNRRFDNPQERLLAGLGQAARLFPPLEAGLHDATPKDCTLTVEQAYDFVREKALVLRAAGIGVLLPGIDTRFTVRARLGSRPSKSKGSAGPGVLNWDSVVSFDWQVALDGEPLSREEFEQLAALKQPLVQVRGRWVELRPELLEQALAFFRSHPDGGEIAIGEAIRLALSPDGVAGIPIEQVETEGPFDQLLRGLHDGAQRQTLTEPPGFIGQLRPYQQAGLSWLATLRRHGLGACLADDMGLGKTVQVIALLLHQRQTEGGGDRLPALLICPTSVTGNWKRELARFAPELRVLVYHGAGRDREQLAAEAARHDVVISTYALLHRDEAELSGVQWGEVILDEAQNIKNAATRSAQAARRLPARWRVAMTGTPVENRLSDLWSIFNFLNPGYLGNGEEFRRRFSIPIERDHQPEAATRLKALTAPFILRRLKTDRTIIDDLPEKNEMKVFAPLTREQATLYEAVLNQSMAQIDDAEGVQRRGQILATMMKLKQVCNHPALFLHDGSRPEGRSGKLARMTEMLEEMLAIDERALIFTQFTEMGAMLKDYLEGRFGREALFLHGGSSATARDRMVSRFQNDAQAPPFFILSIKAGGAGLNLTRANHVFHFDRWWNPAVENQATDRAFRIGQRRDVQVHKFICGGTFEEALDGIIERKQQLSESIVGAGESWITEMSTDQLRDLFALRGDAVGE